MLAGNQYLAGKVKNCPAVNSSGLLPEQWIHSTEGAGKCALVSERVSHTPHHPLISASFFLARLLHFCIGDYFPQEEEEEELLYPFLAAQNPAVEVSGQICPRHGFVLL